MKTLPIVYEVNIAMPPAVFAANENWLYEHFQAVLREAGFLRAHVFSDPSPTERSLTIQYVVQDRAMLDAYLERASTAMRASTQDRLGPGYRVTRRILETVVTLEAKCDQSSID